MTGIAATLHAAYFLRHSSFLMTQPAQNVPTMIAHVVRSHVCMIGNKTPRYASHRNIASSVTVTMDDSFTHPPQLRSISSTANMTPTINAA
jgi:hypothetical protein